MLYHRDWSARQLCAEREHRLQENRMSWAARSSPSKNSANGGAVHTVFQCTRCSRHYTFDSTILPERPTAGQNNLSKAMQVAFITAGLTHAMYKKVSEPLHSLSNLQRDWSGCNSTHPNFFEPLHSLTKLQRERWTFLVWQPSPS